MGRGRRRRAALPVKGSRGDFVEIVEELKLRLVLLYDFRGVIEKEGLYGTYVDGNRAFLKGALFLYGCPQAGIGMPEGQRT